MPDNPENGALTNGQRAVKANAPQHSERLAARRSSDSGRSANVARPVMMCVCRRRSFPTRVSPIDWTSWR